MRTKHILLCLALVSIVLACDEEDAIQDTINESLAFAGSSNVNLNEADNSTTPYPLVVQLYAFQPYTEDIDLTISTTGTNAAAGTDFSISPTSVKVKAGSLV